MVPFVDLAAQQARIRPQMEAAIARVLDHGQYIMGPEIEQLERALAASGGCRHVVACASGTDALILALLALEVGPGDVVCVPSFTFAATAEAVACLGAHPLFVDVAADTFNLDPASLEEGIARARQSGLRLRGVIAVDLFGQPADYDSIEPICQANGLWLIADAAQSFGATYRDRRVGQMGKIATTSFFPAKPLGCYGDGGAVFTEDDRLAEILRSLRVHGQGQDKYENVRVGINGRMDTIQAAILLEKLAIFAEEIEARRRVAARYEAGLTDLIQTPGVPDAVTSVWAQYTIRVGDGGRDALAASLKHAGIPTAVYYRTPLHRQPAYACYPRATPDLSASDRLSKEVLSLPMHPYLEEDTQARIVSNVRAWLEAAL